MSQLEIICGDKKELLKEKVSISELRNYRFWDVFNAAEKKLSENTYLDDMSPSYFVAYHSGKEAKKVLKKFFKNPHNEELQKKNYHHITLLNAKLARLALINFRKVY